METKIDTHLGYMPKTRYGTHLGNIPRNFPRNIICISDKLIDRHDEMSISE